MTKALSRMLLAAGLALGLILAACTLYKPTRILAPEAFGLTCPDETLCIDDIAALPEARALRTEAIAFVETRLAPFDNPPRVIFCKTPECSAAFGTNGTRGLNVGTYGAIISDIGWQPYIVRHELIHHLQNERFGVFAASRSLPRWFIEGMAYVHSQDPRRPFPMPQIEAQIARYEAWEAAGNSWQDLP